MAQRQAPRFRARVGTTGTPFVYLGPAWCNDFFVCSEGVKSSFATLQSSGVGANFFFADANVGSQSRYSSSRSVPLFDVRLLLARATYGRAPSLWRCHASSYRSVKGTTDRRSRQT